MQAAVYRAFGGPEVVRIETVADPVPKPNEILIRVRATTVSAADWRLRSLQVPAGFGWIVRLVVGPFSPRRPILGTELSGTVAAIGPQVRRFAVGDEVFAYLGARLGAHAELCTISEDGAVLHKPPQLSFEESAAISFGGVTALRFLRDRGKLQPGEKVLIIGASGAVGSAAVQLAKHLGAVVTGVTSTPNVELVRSLGADRVIDYRREDWRQPGESYDLICDTVGVASIADATPLLTEQGRLLLVAAGLPEMLRGVWVSLTGKKKVLSGDATGTAQDLEDLKRIIEAGAYKPVIGQVLPLSRIAEAHALVDTGHKRGNVIVTVQRGA
ncbi:MAG: NAD(P)-dependent alcohol dehydrogenase [Deltaproteobacteria bacterium]|nr:NAD(P)-dependent alcohol dehydrogenase [Deltaproteobacteria bacterium]